PGSEMHFFVSRRRRQTRSKRDWSSDVCSSDLMMKGTEINMSENKSMMKEMEELFTFILQQIEGTKLPKGKKSQIREEILGLQSRSEERRVGKEGRDR